MRSDAGPAFARGETIAKVMAHAVVALVAVATVAAAAATPIPVLAVVPAALAGLAYWAIKVPLRYPVALLLVLLLVPDSNIVSVGQWRTPLAFLGDMMHFGLNREEGATTGLTGAEAIVLLLLAVHVVRRLKGSRVDGPAQAEPAQVLGAFLALFLAGVLVAEVVGLARGQPSALWKIRILLQPIPYALLFLAAFRTERDAELVGRVVVAAACFRSVLAFVVQRLATLETGGPYAFATHHGDSVLFTAGMFIVLADVALRPDRRRTIRALLVVPLILIGAYDNGRRTFWVMAPMTFFIGYALAPMRGWKRSLSRFALVVGPVLAVYVAAGWEREGAIFAPVRTIRGVMDTSVSRSSYWREVENWNIAMSMRTSPLSGAGLGAQYTEVMPNDDISMFYREYREWPHNSLLGLLFLMGPLGFTAYTSVLGLVCFLSFRAFRLSADPGQRVAAFGCLTAVVSCLVMAYSDIGPNSPQYRVLLSLAMAISARLAVATGAWPARRARPA